MSTLGYWKIRGYCQSIKYLLEYVGENYKLVTYEMTEGPPSVSHAAWYEAKDTLGLDFPNLPYYMDEKVKLTQSGTIMKYLARKYRLEGSTDEEKVRVDLAYDELLDLRGDGFVKLTYDPDYENLRKDYAPVWGPRILNLEKYLGGKQWFAGDKLTYVDFMAYETLENQRALELGLFDKTPKLNAFSKRFEELSGVKEYLASGKLPKAFSRKWAAVFNKQE